MSLNESSKYKVDETIFIVVMSYSEVMITGIILRNCSKALLKKI